MLPLQDRLQMVFFLLVLFGSIIILNVLQALIDRENTFDIHFVHATLGIWIYLYTSQI